MTAWSPRAGPGTSHADDQRYRRHPWPCLRTAREVAKSAYVVHPRHKREHLKFWVFVADIAELILGWHGLWAYDASLNLRSHVLRLCNKHAASFWPATNRFGPDVTVMTAWLQCSLKTDKGLEEPGKASHQKPYKSRALIRGRQKVPIRLVNVSERDHVRAGSTTMGRSEPAMWTALWATTRRVILHQTESKSQTRPDIEETTAEFQGAFATTEVKMGRHYANARPIGQPPHNFPLSKTLRCTTCWTRRN
jgi:hypothetical protein